MAKSRVEQQLKELDKLHQKGRLTDDEYHVRRQAILTDTSAAESTGGKRGGLFKWGALGCLGIFGAIGAVVVAVIVIIVVAIGNAGDDTPDTGGDVRVALAPGAVGEIAPQGNGSKLSKVTILEIRDGAEAGLIAPAEGKKYWAALVEVENVGSAEVSSLDWLLRDSTNAESDRTFFSDVGENLEVAYTLTPGGKKQGWVVFEIAIDAQPTWLRADPNPFLKHDLYFDAQ